MKKRTIITITAILILAIAAAWFSCHRGEPEMILIAFGEALAIEPDLCMPEGTPEQGEPDLFRTAESLSHIVRLTPVGYEKSPNSGSRFYTCRVEQVYGGTLDTDRITLLDNGPTFEVGETYWVFLRELPPLSWWTEGPIYGCHVSPRILFHLVEKNGVRYADVGTNPYKLPVGTALEPLLREAAKRLAGPDPSPDTP